MKFQGVITISIAILALILLNPASSKAQISEGQIMTFPGVIEKISTDFGFIIVNETKISLSSGTKIMGEKGNPLTPNDLKQGSPITIEVIKSQNQFIAKHIVVKSKRK